MGVLKEKDRVGGKAGKPTAFQVPILLNRYKVWWRWKQPFLLTQESHVVFGKWCGVWMLLWIVAVLKCTPECDHALSPA